MDSGHVFAAIRSGPDQLSVGNCSAPHEFEEEQGRRSSIDTIGTAARIIAFIAVINETIKPYLAAKGHSIEYADKKTSGVV